VAITSHHLSVKTQSLNAHSVTGRTNQEDYSIGHSSQLSGDIEAPGTQADSSKDIGHQYPETPNSQSVRNALANESLEVQLPSITCSILLTEA